MTPYQLAMLIALGGLMVSFFLVGCGIVQEWRAYRGKRQNKSLTSGLIEISPKRDYWRDWSKPS